jgi:hypothetical protein
MTDWTNFFAIGMATALNSTASRIGTGKKRTSWRNVIWKVLDSADQNAESWKSAVKLSQPTHCECVKPRNGT